MWTRSGAAVPRSVATTLVTVTGSGVRAPGGCTKDCSSTVIRPPDAAAAGRDRADRPAGAAPVAPGAAAGAAAGRVGLARQGVAGAEGAQAGDRGPDTVLVELAEEPAQVAVRG